MRKKLSQQRLGYNWTIPVSYWISCGYAYVGDATIVVTWSSSVGADSSGAAGPVFYTLVRPSVCLSTHLERSWSWLFTHSDQPMSGFTAPSLYPFRFWTLCHPIFSTWYSVTHEILGFCSIHWPLIFTYESLKIWVSDYKASTMLNTVSSRCSSVHSESSAESLSLSKCPGH